MANQVYSNFVLENKLESLLLTRVNINNYVTADYSLTENPGMIKTIHKYHATGDVEDLAMGVGNSTVFESSFTSEDYTVGVTQGKGSYYDEEAMKDPMVVDTILAGMADQMANDFTKKAIIEMKKASLGVECDFSTATSGYLFGKIVDALSKLGENEQGYSILISPVDRAYFRKQLLDSLQYSEGFARTGYIGSVAGAPVIVSAAIPDHVALLVNKEAVTLFLKKGVQAEQDRDPNTRKNDLYLRKVAVVALTDENKVVKLAPAQSTACAITTYTKNAKTIAGTCGTDCYKVAAYVNGVLAFEATPSSGSWTGTAAANLAAGNKVDAIAYSLDKAPKAATQVTVAS